MEVTVTHKASQVLFSIHGIWLNGFKSTGMKFNPPLVDYKFLITFISILIESKMICSGVTEWKTKDLGRFYRRKRHSSKHREEPFFQRRSLQHKTRSTKYSGWLAL